MLKQCKPKMLNPNIIDRKMRLYRPSFLPALNVKMMQIWKNAVNIANITADTVSQVAKPTAWTRCQDIAPAPDRVQVQRHRSAYAANAHIDGWHDQAGITPIEETTTDSWR